MEIDFISTTLIITTFLWLFSLGYLCFAFIALELFKYKKNKKKFSTNFSPPVTILKPIYGLDPDMLNCLRSFCQQDYPKYQVIFGLQDKNDPALPIVKQVIKEFSDYDINCIVNTELHGTNHKVSNLINMYPSIKYEYILIADSDMHVSKKYLNRVMEAFSDKRVGLITCLYHGKTKGEITSKLNAMFINTWFLPSVLISCAFQPMKYCLGATMIVKRSILNKIGGFESLSNHLADDYILGKLISSLGYKIHLSDYIVENIVEETSFRNLILHELRWARTLRRVEPIGYALTFLTDSLVLGIILGITIYAITGSLALLVIPAFLSLILRIMLHNSSNDIKKQKNNDGILLIPLRDILSFFIRVISYTGNSVKWRNNIFSVDHLGLMHNKVISKNNTNETEKISESLT